MGGLRLVLGGLSQDALALSNSIASPAPAAVDDATLVAEVKAGNPAVANAFCQRILPVVDRTVRRLLGRDDSEREDLAQIASIELVKSISRFRGESSLDTWASAVTAHVVYKQIRRRPLERHVSLDLVQDELLHSWRPTGEGVLAAREALSRILRHLDAVGGKLAWTFILHDVLGYSLTEVAAIVDVSEAAAQSRLVRGRARLHERIEDDPELAELFVDLERIVR
jgi:RNA polymerase sigma-70 factor (ECF subfamily)